ncbi:MAG: AAA family ATPase [Magnetococcales bacterium]|nr:AAA family ATPase [Magnetococcales bacterium]
MCIGKETERLGHGDWVRAGRRHLERNHGVCPFCQQSAPERLAGELNDYFDATFLEEEQLLARLEQQYRQDAHAIRQWLDQILLAPARLLDVELLQHLKYRFEQGVTINLYRMENKRKEPGLSVTLESLADDLCRLGDLVAGVNQQIVEQNRLLKQLHEEQGRLIAEFWRHLLDGEFAPLLQAYHLNSREYTQTLLELDQRITQCKQDMRTLEQERTALTDSLITIQPAIDGMNGLLEMIGMHGFVVVPAEPHGYRLVRPNGTDALETISDGERGLLTLLYFYYLARGSLALHQVADDRIVVLDDPTVGLDPETMHFAARVLRKLIGLVRQPESRIRQLWILTHDPRFLQDVTVHPFRLSGQPLEDESFWKIRKDRHGSSVERLAVIGF